MIVDCDGRCYYRADERMGGQICDAGESKEVKFCSELFVGLFAGLWVRTAVCLTAALPM